jgi:hypothetical protein
MQHVRIPDEADQGSGVKAITFPVRSQYVAQTLWTGATSGRTRNSILPTRLTQQRRTEVKGKVWMAAPEPPKAEHFCRGCGTKIAIGRLNCANCSVDGATERLAVAAKLGRVAAQRPEARAKHVASRKQHAQACSAWDESTQPAWLTSEVFSQQIQPLLSGYACISGICQFQADGMSRQILRNHCVHQVLTASPFRLPGGAAHGLLQIA